MNLLKRLCAMDGFDFLTSHRGQLDLHTVLMFHEAGTHTYTGTETRSTT